MDYRTELIGDRAGLVHDEAELIIASINRINGRIGQIGDKSTMDIQ